MKAAFELQQSAISEWWLTYAVDEKSGGFHSEISNQNQVAVGANKGVIQNARILWYFSEAAKYSKNKREHSAAQYAFRYFVDTFWDQQHAGVIWEVDAQGSPTNTRKQIYAQAFAIYALNAYYQLTEDAQALALVEALFDVIERSGFDRLRGGYIEAFDEQWNAIDDFRLSSKDLNWPKTVNTHLHIMEAYTSLYKTIPTSKVANALEGLINTFLQYFISPNHYLLGFFDLHWNDKSEAISFGHDIESSWLMWEAALALGNPKILALVKPKILCIAEACLEKAIGQYSEVREGYDLIAGGYLNDRMWWVQAEALVGFLNAYELTKEDRYWYAFEKVWQFVSRYQVDLQYGEWRWLSTLDSSSKFDDSKSCFWKGPYHNGRAMIEVQRRLSRLLPSTLS